jgi:hypothetical protein
VHYSDKLHYSNSDLKVKDVVDVESTDMDGNENDSESYGMIRYKCCIIA